MGMRGGGGGGGGGANRAPHRELIWRIAHGIEIFFFRWSAHEWLAHDGVLKGISPSRCTKHALNHYPEICACSKLVLGPPTENNIGGKSNYPPLPTPPHSQTKPNSTALLKSYKPKFPGNLFSQDQSWSGIRFIGPPEIPLCSVPCGGKVWPIWKRKTHYVIKQIL